MLHQIQISQMSSRQIKRDPYRLLPLIHPSADIHTYIFQHIEIQLTNTCTTLQHRNKCPRRDDLSVGYPTAQCLRPNQMIIMQFDLGLIIYLKLLLPDRIRKTALNPFVLDPLFFHRLREYDLRETFSLRDHQRTADPVHDLFRPIDRILFRRQIIPCHRRKVQPFSGLPVKNHRLPMQVLGNDVFIVSQEHDYKIISADASDHPGLCQLIPQSVYIFLHQFRCLITSHARIDQRKVFQIKITIAVILLLFLGNRFAYRPQNTRYVRDLELHVVIRKHIDQIQKTHSAGKSVEGFLQDADLLQILCIPRFHIGPPAYGADRSGTTIRNLSRNKRLRRIYRPVLIKDIDRTVMICLILWREKIIHLHFCHTHHRTDRFDRTADLVFLKSLDLLQFQKTGPQGLRIFSVIDRHLFLPS